ncbi:hypothetical protein FRC20_001450 [Serendipita sp. 405]|nr:hypothetical protein FRC20_001450 [Serendipita sp. 405]
MLDYLSFLIIHRFSSPRWYSKLQEHFLLPPYHVTHSNSSRTSSPTPPERILDLLPHQVLLYAPEVPSSLPTQERRDDVQGEATSVSLSLNPSPYKSIFGPIQRPMHAPTRLTDTRQKLGQRLLAVTFKPLDGSNKDFKDIRVARHSDVVPDSPGGSGFEDLSVYPSRSSDGQHNHSSSNRHPEELSFSDRHEDNSWPWTNRHSHNMSRGGISQDEVHSPATAIGASSRLQTTTSAFQAAISRPSPRLTSVPNAMTAAFGSGSHESHRLSPSYATGRSPPSPGMIRGGLTFSPFAAPVSLGNNGANILGGMGTLQMSTSAPTAYPYHQHPQYLPNAFSKDRDDTLTGGQFTRPNLLAHQPLSASSQTTNESSMSRTDTDSRDGSSNDFVDLGSMRDGISSAPQHPRDPTVSPTLTRSSGSGFTANSSNAQQGLAFKPSYADVMSLSRDHRGIHRHETAILIGKGGSSGSSNASQQVAAGKAFGSTSSTTMTDIHGDGPTVAPPAPPIYAESFFWPLLDALDKARTQVSSPHNRAQCVRHSVVGQELPPSARTRLGLTFKEYVAAAARQSIVVTGDSGDKAWIAMKEWKYPGKLSSSSSSSAGSHPLASSSGAHIVHGQQGLYHHGSRISGK